MRIIQISAHFSPNIGGVETHLDDLVKGLIDRKNEVIVLTYQPLTTDIAAPFFEKKGKLSIIRIPWLRGLFYLLVNKPFLEFIYLFPGLFVVFPFLLLKKDIQVIHAHGLVAATVGVFWGKIFGKRVVISTHSLYHFPKDGIYPKFVKLILSQAAICLCLSKKSVSELIQLGIVPSRIRQFVYWIDTFLYKPNSNKSFKKEIGVKKTFNLLFVGRLIKEKGIKILLQVMRNFKEDTKLIIAGDGPLRDEIIKEVQQSGNIRFVGKLSGSELVNYYNLSDLLVVPSIHDEGFGRVILEALSCGIPVLASNRGSIPEAMDSSVGKMVKISLSDLKKEIAYLKNHPDVLKKLKQNTRKFALKRYSEKNIKTIINSYDN